MCSLSSYLPFYREFQRVFTLLFFFFLYHLSDRSNFLGVTQRTCKSSLYQHSAIKILARRTFSLFQLRVTIIEIRLTHSRHVQYFNIRIPLHLRLLLFFFIFRFRKKKSAKCRHGSRAIFPHGELFLTNERGGKKLMRNCETWEPRVDRSIAKGVRYLRHPEEEIHVSVGRQLA